MVQSRVLPPLVRGRWFPMTWDEFLAWSPSEGQSEWVDGKGIAYVSNSEPHVRIVVFLTELLGLYLRISGIGRLFVDSMLLRLPHPEGTRPSGRMPDLFVVGRSDLDRVHHQWVDKSALLVIEIISEESADRDLREKRDEYARAGVLEYLLVDARLGRPGFTYLRLDPDGEYQPVAPDVQGRYSSTALPGFWLDPTWLDQDPPPNVERLMLRIDPEGYRRYLEQILAESPE